MYLLQRGFRGFRPKSHAECRKCEAQAARKPYPQEPQIRNNGMAVSAGKPSFGEQIRIVAARVNCREVARDWLA
jgi:hypothetical protein